MLRHYLLTIAVIFAIGLFLGVCSGSWVLAGLAWIVLLFGTLVAAFSDDDDDTLPPVDEVPYMI